MRYRWNIGNLKVSRASVCRMGSTAAHLHAHVGQATHVLHQHLHAALCNLRYANERGVALFPVGVSQEGGQQAGSQRGNGVSSQRQRKPVQALLPKLVQLPFALALVLVCVRAVPVWLILQGANTDLGPIQCFQQRWVIALTRMSVGYNACAALLSLSPRNFFMQEERLQLAMPSQTSLFLQLLQAGIGYIQCRKTAILLTLAEQGPTSMSRRKKTRHWNRRASCCGSLRIMPGAFSRASHSVTRNSVASCLVLSSSSVASDICIQMKFEAACRLHCQLACAVLQLCRFR